MVKTSGPQLRNLDTATTSLSSSPSHRPRGSSESPSSPGRSSPLPAAPSPSPPPSSRRRSRRRRDQRRRRHSRCRHRRRRRRRRRRRQRRRRRRRSRPSRRRRRRIVIVAVDAVTGVDGFAVDADLHPIGSNATYHVMETQCNAAQVNAVQCKGGGRAMQYIINAKATRSNANCRTKLSYPGTNVCDRSCTLRARTHGRGAGAFSGNAARMAKVPQARKPLSLVETRAE